MNTASTTTPHHRNTLSAREGTASSTVSKKSQMDDIQSMPPGMMFSPDAAASASTGTSTHNHATVTVPTIHGQPPQSSSLPQRQTQRQTQPSSINPSTVGSSSNNNNNNNSNNSNKSTNPTTTSARNKRKCRFPGCPRTIKSQGHCQKHGAIVKKCKIPDCKKQAQGRHDGMCKRHWNAEKNAEAATTAANTQHKHDHDHNHDHGADCHSGGCGSGGGNGSSRSKDHSLNTMGIQDEQQRQHSMQEGIQQQQNRGVSVYDSIIPQSIAWRQGTNQSLNHNDAKSHHCDKNTLHGSTTTKHSNPSSHEGKDTNHPSSFSSSITPTLPSLSSTSSSPSSMDQMPLVEFLRNGLTLEPGWHRKQERTLRNPNKPLKSISEQLQPEEKQLILFETMLLSGTIYSSSNSSQQRINKDLAHAWGREKGFHNLLVSQMCERRGDLSRKRRSDVGKSLSEKEKATFRTKLIKTRSEKKAKFSHVGNGSSNGNGGDNGSNGTTIPVEREQQQQQQQQHLQLPNPIFESKPLTLNNNDHIQPTHPTQSLSHVTKNIDNGKYPSTTITRPHHFVPGDRMHDQYQLTDHHQHTHQQDPHTHQLSNQWNE